MTFQDPLRDSTLRSYRVLDTGPERAFDDLADLARQVCETPVGLVSLIDGARQWFKSARGTTLCETPLSNSVCATILGDTDVVVIPDTSLDPRSADVIGDVDGQPMRFYAGMPLTAPNGVGLGSLCVIDTRPRELSQMQVNTLRVLGRQVVAQLELRRTLQRGDVLRKEIDHRVKNSLQSVAALARMQARRADNDHTREALQIVARRIASVAALNSEIYQASGDGHIGLPHFLETIGGLIRESAPDGVEVDVAVDDMPLSSAKAGAVAMVINEFATNAFKHAFPDDRAGRITVRLRRTREGWVELVCQDDGVGLPVGDDSPAADGLGFTIIESAVDQLFGKLSRFDAAPGHGIRVAFPVTA